MSFNLVEYFAEYQDGNTGGENKCKMTGLTKPDGYNNNKCSGFRSRCFAA
jgi:hypothetical protein